MAITRHSNFDKTVQTIIDRNNISNKVNGMMVVVLDAIADPNAGAGKAIYRWESSDTSWILVSKSTTETMNFATEELTIVNGEAQLSYIPVDNKVWNGVILNGQLIYADLNIRAITISNGKISGLASEVNGMTLRVTYAYGTISQQITTAIEESVDSAIANNIKTINGVEIIGSGNIEVTAALPELKTINSESILGAGNIEIITDISGKADISYVDNQISSLIDLAPAQLDTFKEIADKLVTDEGVVSALTAVVSGKANSTDVYSKIEVDSLISSIDTGSNAVISLTEYLTGNKRGSKDIYGIEIDLGALPDTTAKQVSFTFNSSYTYWIDASNSYSSSSSEVITIPYVGYIGDDVSVKLDKTNNKIVIITAKDRSAFTNTKLVLLYTK